MASSAPVPSSMGTGVPALITLTTDFGLHDAYVSMMHGVILSVNRQVTIVDICHSVSPQDISAASYIFGTAYPFFPSGAIHVVVVDPGVGSLRGALALSTATATFVAPDNGVLSRVIRDSSPSLPAAGGSISCAQLHPSLRVVLLTNDRYWRDSVSSTFHGRDLFAPVAAHLASGTPLESFGEPAAQVFLLPEYRPTLRPDGALVGHVVHLDHFGNVITDLTPASLAGYPQALRLIVRDQPVPGIYHYYAEASGLMALYGSSGCLEIALNGGNAAVALGAVVGDQVQVEVNQS